MAEIEPVENTGCKQDVNRAMKSGHVRTSWICNDWTAGLTADHREVVTFKVVP